jgi:prephenate dehydrogenase
MEPLGEPDDIANTTSFLAGSDGGGSTLTSSRRTAGLPKPHESKHGGTVMFSIIGIAGRVGGSAASRLLEMGKQVRAVIRDEAKGHVWASKNASVAVADMTDGDGLGRATAGSEAVFVMLPVSAVEEQHSCLKPAPVMAGFAAITHEDGTIGSEFRTRETGGVSLAILHCLACPR